MNNFSFIKVLNKYKFTVLLFLYLLVIAYFQVSFRRTIVVEALSLMLFMHLISKSGIFTYVFVSVFSLLITFDVVFAFSFRSIPHVGVVAAVFDTDMREITSVMKDFLLISVVLFILTVSLIYISARELKKSKISAKWSGLILFSFLFIANPVYFFRLKKTNNFTKEIYTNNRVLAYHFQMKERFPLFYGPVSAAAVHYIEKNESKKYLLQERFLPTGLSLNDTTNTPQKIFFIIGESATRKHFSLYGYDVKTTPFLDSLRHHSCHRIPFYNGVSPSCFTRHAIRFLLSFATPLDIKPLFSQKSLIELANEAGYQSIWISNQISFYYDDYPALVSSCAHDSYFSGKVTKEKIFDKGSKKIIYGYKDLDLIPVIREKYNKNAKQIFFIFLIGSHTTYSDRYDKIDEMSIEGDDDSRILHYDRSIHHTDRVLRELYQMMKKDTSSIMYYVSDHGECLRYYRGNLDGDISQFEIPMLFINQTDIDIASIIDKYYLRENEWINTLSSIYILAELMGYSIEDEVVDYVKKQEEFICHGDYLPYKFTELLKMSEEKK